MNLRHVLPAVSQPLSHKRIVGLILPYLPYFVKSRVALFRVIVCCIFRLSFCNLPVAFARKIGYNCHATPSLLRDLNAHTTWGRSFMKVYLKRLRPLAAIPA